MRPPCENPPPPPPAPRVPHHGGPATREGFRLRRCAARVGRLLCPLPFLALMGKLYTGDDMSEPEPFSFRFVRYLAAAGLCAIFFAGYLAVRRLGRNRL